MDPEALRITLEGIQNQLDELSASVKLVQEAQAASKARWAKLLSGGTVAAVLIGGWAGYEHISGIPRVAQDRVDALVADAVATAGWNSLAEPLAAAKTVSQLLVVPDAQDGTVRVFFGRTLLDGRREWCLELQPDGMMRRQQFEANNPQSLGDGERVLLQSR